MNLTLEQFEILVYLEKNNEVKVSQRKLSSALKMSLGAVNKNVTELINQETVIYDKSLHITEKGLIELQPYRVKRAIFLAAGFGSRMVPLTFNTPKPLIKVHGKSMIETLLDACKAAQIEEFIIVVGYLGEQFEVLKKKYPNITIINNSLYNDANNISSALCASEYLGNSYVLESDLVLYNADLIRKYEYRSNFLGKFVERTDDWCFKVNKRNKILGEIVGGVNCYQMYGISYFDEVAGKNLQKDILEVYQAPGGKEKFWEQVPLVFRKENYDVYVRECQEGDIIEIDSFNELKQVDSIYDC